MRSSLPLKSFKGGLANCHSTPTVIDRGQRHSTDASFKTEKKIYARHFVLF